MLRLAVGQMEPRINDQDRSMSRLQAILHSASENGVNVLVLPELINSGYVFGGLDEVSRMSESIPEGVFSQALLEWSAEGRMVVAGMCERRDDGFYNSAAVFGSQKHLQTYRKVHLF
ncbi:MAG: nitrilase-related carbon-nitrogen hydrolase, partial [Promethearchaeota archaeon]